jgi:hypothetical protein
LVKISGLGFPLVGFPNQPEFNNLLATEALHSPQIMQTLCLEACRMHGPDQPLEQVQPSAEHLAAIRALTVRSYDHSTMIDILSQGPETRGTERVEFTSTTNQRWDVYQCLLQALKQDPPFLNLSLDEIRARVRSLLVDTREPNIRSALQQYSKLFKPGTSPTLDWDDEKKRLTIIDPHFYFHLRNKV